MKPLLEYVNELLGKEIVGSVDEGVWDLILDDGKGVLYVVWKRWNSVGGNDHPSEFLDFWNALGDEGKDTFLSECVGMGGPF
jgi:hypothetical protein